MKIVTKTPARKYRCGANNQVEISDCGTVHLDDDEQLTFKTSSGKEHDFTAKSWGFYATPSVNGRLVDQGFKTALVKNSHGRIYVLVVDKTKMDEFNAYIEEDKQQILEWLDER